MIPNLSLKQIMILLLALPLSCQIVFDGILVCNLIGLDRAAQRETNAKLVISALQDLRSILLRNTTVLLLNPSAIAADPTAFRTNAKRIGESIRRLTADNKKAGTIVDRYEQKLEHLFDLLVCVDRDGSVNLARFANWSEFKEELALVGREAAACEDELFAEYRPIAQEFRPAALSQRKSVFNFTIAALITNSIIVTVLAILFGSTTIARLNLLMENMRRFSRGEKKLPQLSGSDELSELDREFSRMVRARNRAEQTQQSIYSMVSHDLQTPLSALSVALSEMLEKELTEMSESVAKKLARARSVTEHLLKLTDSFLDLERSTLGKLELRLKLASPREIVNTAIDAVHGSADAKNVTITSEFLYISPNLEGGDARTPNGPGSSAENELIMCDQDRVTQVIMNFVSNAVKYSPKDSKIKVSVLYDIPRLCRIEVKDEGRGFSDEQKQRLFQRFSQLDKKDASVGAGLGLYICKLLIDAHGGRIGADSLPERGSIFWIELPYKGRMQDSN